jgi:hypothetical protein
MPRRTGGFLEPDLETIRRGEAMNHTTCDLCGRELFSAGEVRYEVRVEVRAAYDPLDLSEEDLEKDYRAEIAGVLRQLEGLSEGEAQGQVYRAFDFDRCPACQRRYVRDPLPKALPA